MFDNLKFGTFREIEPQLVEITVNEGVEIDEEKIACIEKELLARYENSYAVLVNRVNTYSHTHQSMVAIANLKNLAGLAILVYSDFSRHSAEIHTLYNDNVRVFDNHPEALTRLQESK